jgi:hypothetical protein
MLVKPLCIPFSLPAFGMPGIQVTLGLSTSSPSGFHFLTGFPFLQSESSVIQYTTGNSFPFSVRPFQWQFFFAAVRLIPLKTFLSVPRMDDINSLGGQTIRPQQNRSRVLSDHGSSCLGLHGS